MGLFDTITSMAQDVVDNQPKTVLGTVTNYYDGSCTVATDNGTFENIKCVNVPKIGSACLLIPVGEEYTCIPNETDDTAMIYALGLGKFHINEQGHLIYETAIGGTNPFSINNNGHLIVNLDNSYKDKFKINEEGDLIYEL
jgi:hypothetical protein